MGLKNTTTHEHISHVSRIFYTTAVLKQPQINQTHIEIAILNTQNDLKPW